jgi:hypothetical protein
LALSPSITPHRGFPEPVYRQYQVVLAATNYFDGAIAESTAFSSRSSGQVPSLGDLPLIVLSHENADIERLEAETEWSRMQKELANLSSNSTQIIAEQSGHYIQLDQPELVNDSIHALIRVGDFGDLEAFNQLVLKYESLA